MIFVILSTSLIVIGAILFFVAFITGKENYYDAFWLLKPIFLMSILCIFLSLLIPPYESGYSDKETLYSTLEIECLNDNLDTEGSIRGFYFITTGYENTEQYYYYMYKTDKGLKTSKLKASDTYVNIITNDEKPRIEQYVYKSEIKDDEISAFANLFTWYGFGIPAPKPNYEEPKVKTAYYKLYVPEGSITSSYTIDLE